MDFSKVESFSVSGKARSFSAVVLTNTNQSAPKLNILLLLQDSNEYIVALYGYEKIVYYPGDDQDFHSILIWIDLTDTLFSSRKVPIPVAVLCSVTPVAWKVTVDTSSSINLGGLYAQNPASRAHQDYQHSGISCSRYWCLCIPRTDAYRRRRDKVLHR